MRLTIITLAVIATLAFPTPASADPVSVDEHGCPEGTTWTETAGVPLCLDPMWLDGSWNDDPRDCVYGYYQGTCAPAPKPPVVLEVDAYLFQMDAPSPEYVVEVEVKRAAWLVRCDLFRIARIPK